MAKALFVIALAATFAVLESSAADYCRLKSCYGRKHTVCRYGFLRVDYNRCTRVKSSKLSQSDISEILNAHNEYRRLVASGSETRGRPGPQPPASNLEPLKWDQEIANIAQTWANQCMFGHDQCRNVERFQVGQNVAENYSRGGAKAKWSSMVTGWYNEVEFFNRNHVKSFTGVNLGEIGHYSQIVWANTKLLGCGGVRYNDGSWDRAYLVCNYGPAGNWQGQEVYKTR